MFFSIRYLLADTIHVVTFGESVLPIATRGLVCIHLALLHLLRPLRATIITIRYLLRRQFWTVLPAGRIVLRWLRQLMTILTRIDVVEGARPVWLSRRALHTRIVAHLRMFTGLCLSVVNSLVGCAVINPLHPI